MTKTIATANATTTDQTPPTPASVVCPHWGSCRKATSIRGSTQKLITRLTATTTTSGNAAAHTAGSSALRFPWPISCGSNSCEATARSRTSASSAAFSCVAAETSSYPTPARRAPASARPSHHMPNPIMMSEAITPKPGAAKGVVPKNGMGIAFWIEGVPGNADMVNVEVPSTIAAGIRWLGMLAALKSECAMGASTKNATNRLTPP